MFLIPIFGFLVDVFLVTAPVLVPLALVTMTVAAFWEDIREWAVDLAHGWVRRTLGKGAERLLTDAIVVLDRVMVAGRKTVRRAVYGKVSGTKGRQHIVTEEVPFEDLPESVQAELRNGSIEHTYGV